MPRCTYLCVNCGHKFEIGITFPTKEIPPGTTCPACGGKTIVEALQEFVDTYPLRGEDIARYLPARDCAACGLADCLAFAEALLSSSAKAAQCSELDAELSDRLQKVASLQPSLLAYDTAMSMYPGAYVGIGNPTADSPVLVTGNFIGTVNVLRSILENTSTNAHLLVTDTHGFSVDNAVATRWFRSQNVFAVLGHVVARVNHTTLIIPGLAASFKAELQRITKWRVLVGPVSGYELPLFLYKRSQARADSA